MNTIRFTALLLVPTAIACGLGSRYEESAPEGSVDPAAQSAPPSGDPLDMATEGSSDELVAALQKGTDPVFVVLKPGTRLREGDVVAAGESPAARALRLASSGALVVALAREGVEVEAEVALADVRYLKDRDLAALGIEIDRAATVAVGEVDDFELDEAARRAGGAAQTLGPAAQDFDCIARFAKITASRDFVPFPLTNCSAPQPPVSDAERIADATQAKNVAQNLFNQMVVDYRHAQEMIATLNARMAAIQNAWVFIHYDPYYKEYNVLHFKKVLHGHKSYNDRFERAEQLLIYSALVTTKQIAAYASVPAPSATTARSEANRIVATKWNCKLGRGVLENGGRMSSGVVGVSLETLGAPFIDIQVMLDDHPPLAQSQGWGGVFGVSAAPNLPSDITRLPVSSFVPVRATVGLPIVMFRFQPLDAKKQRPVGKACNLRAAIVE